MSCNNEGAKQQYREAFSRLKQDIPRVLKKGTPVTQNNVAREAGRDPSALKKERYPDLVEDIQNWISEFAKNGAPTPRQLALKSKKKNAGLKERLMRTATERDLALSRQVESDSLVLDLVREVEQLRAVVESRNVSPIKPNK